MMKLEYTGVRRMSCYLVVCMTLVLTACAALVPTPQQATNAAARVVASYDVANLLARADMVLTQSLFDGLPDTVETAKREQLKELIGRHFEKKALTVAVRNNLVAQAMQTQHTRALVGAADALESPLAKRLHGLQSKVGDEGFASAYNAFVQQAPGRQREARLQQIKGLIHDMAIVELQTAFQAALLNTMLTTRNALMPPAQALSPAEIDQQMDSNRTMLQKQLHEQLPPILLYAYRNVGDGDFRKYVALQGSDAMVWTNRALARAIGDALREAGKKIPKQAANL